MRAARRSIPAAEAMVSLPGVGAGVVFKSLVAARSLRSSYPASTGAVSLFVSRQPAGPRGSPGGRRAGPGATAGADRWRPASRAEDATGPTPQETKTKQNISGGRVV